METQYTQHNKKDQLLTVNDTFELFLTIEKHLLDQFVILKIRFENFLRI